MNTAYTNTYRTENSLRTEIARLERKSLLETTSQDQLLINEQMLIILRKHLEMNYILRRILSNSIFRT